MGTDRQYIGKKKENVSPEELWKKISQQLTFKKSEADGKASVSATTYFQSVSAELAKISAEKEAADKEGFLEKEIQCSLLNMPMFRVFDEIGKEPGSAKTPSFFPKNALKTFGNSEFYRRLDLDTLFFIFYHCSGSIQQTYAAAQLKQYAWRFHLKYKMWFQRLDEPKLITAEYEKGEFLFFDYETTWSFMKKNEFVFEYYYLEQQDFY